MNFLNKKHLSQMAFIAGFSLIAGLAQADVLLRDTFTDDVAGMAPNGAEIGSAYYGGIANQGGANVTYQVQNFGGNNQLVVTSAGTPGSSDNGSIVEYFPTSQPTVSRVSYDFRVTDIVSSAGQNAFLQELVLSPLGTNLGLFWSSVADGMKVFLASTVPGDQTFTTVDTGLVYALNTNYFVQWVIDAVNDVYSLSINGTALVSGAGFGADAQNLRELAFENNFATVGTQVIDNVLIETVPEPSTWALLMIAMMGFVVMRHQRLAQRLSGKI